MLCQCIAYTIFFYCANMVNAHKKSDIELRVLILNIGAFPCQVWGEENNRDLTIWKGTVPAKNSSINKKLRAIFIKLGVLKINPTFDP
jgi:hypothetical protein